MRKVILLLIMFVALGVSAQNSKSDRYVVVISLDGCRWDYPEWYNTPSLDRMAAKGVKSGMIPCFPSKTFPNHYSIATGLVPDHHGIIANSFLERGTGTIFSLGNVKTKMQPRFWGGEPIWLTAKHQGVKTAIFYWPGSDVKINGEYPDVYHKYDSPDQIPLDERVDSILMFMNQPESKRTHLIMGYFEEPDHNGHSFGPQDKRTRQAVEHMDSLMGKLYDGMMKLPYADKIDFIVLSDHGMALVTPERRIGLMNHLQPEWIEKIEGDMPANIYVKEGCQEKVYEALQGIQHLSVWKKGGVPAELSYGTNKNCGDVIASPDLGYVATDTPLRSAGGKHGFDPNYNDMHALFRACGPDFKHIDHTHFHNTDVYPLICKILGITPAKCDGNIKEIEDMLK